MKTSRTSTEPPSSDDPGRSDTRDLGPPNARQRDRRRSEQTTSYVIPSISGYDQLELIGEGGMGSVYRARDVQLKRLVALKMLKSGTLTLERVARFRTEAEALARLTHPHIVPLFAWNEQGPFLVLEYVAGGTLEDRLQDGPLEIDEAVHLIAILARAVQAAHDAGVVHRDLKPGNVLMAQPVTGNSGTVCGGFPKVSDFGLAQLLDCGRDVTASGMVLGTPAYMAPEQAAGNSERIGPPCDVWALGVILYRALTDRLPYQATDPEELLRWIINHPPRPPRELRRDIPRKIQAVCLACLKKNPDARPTAEGLASRLERYLHQPGDATTPLPAARPRKTLPRLALAGLLAVGVGATVGLFATFLPPRAAITAPHEPPPRPPAAPVKIASLRVSQSFPVGVFGETLLFARPAARVRVEAELAEPGYAFLIELGRDGSEKLLWPTAEALPVGAQASIRFPSEQPNDWYSLGDDDRAGEQAFVVVASREPLPPFQEWKRRRGETLWRRMPPTKHVFSVEDGVSRIVGPGAGGLLPPGPIMNVLERQVRSMRTQETETVRLLAFPVLGRPGW